MRCIRVPILVVMAVSGLLIACGGSDSTSGSPEPVPVTDAKVYSREQVLTAAVDKYLRFATEYSPEQGFPRSINNSGNWQQESLNWTSSFFTGSLWQLAVYTQREEFYQQARRWTLPLADGANWYTHDIGFLIDYSFGKAARISGETDYDRPRQKGAERLAARYSEQVEALRSWNHDDYFTVIIDNLMNLSLLFDASSAFAEEDYYNQAYQHSLTTARHFLREDGSSFHVVDFDPLTGEVARKRTHQGAADTSTWARGQAWAVYGFTEAARQTGDADVLEAATSAADYFIRNLPEDGVPWWDFDATASQPYKDTSAAVIAAAGLWLLSKQDVNDAALYRQSSMALVDSLLNDEYTALGAEQAYLLRHASGSVPAGTEIDTALIYADYFFIEALLLQTGVIDSPL